MTKSALRQSLLPLAITMGVGPWLAGCAGADAELSCRDACSRMAECGATETAPCMLSCEDMQGIMDEDAFQALGACIVDSDCRDLTEADDGPPSACFNEAIEKGDPRPFESFGQSLCDKMAACLPVFDAQTCSDEFAAMARGEAPGGDEFEGMQIMTVIKADTLNCLSSCVRGTSCSELMTGGDFMDACMRDCGVVFGEGDDSSSGTDGVDAADCHELCTRMTDCDPSEDFYGCQDACTAMFEYGRPDVLAAMASCMLSASCADLSYGDGPVYCMEQAISYVPDGAGDPIITAMCSQVSNCSNGYYSYSECWSDMTQPDPMDDGPGLDFFGFFTPATVQCVSDCISALGCADLNDPYADPIGSCSRDCGVGAFM